MRKKYNTLLVILSLLSLQTCNYASLSDVNLLNFNVNENLISMNYDAINEFVLFDIDANALIASVVDKDFSLDKDIDIESKKRLRPKANILNGFKVEDPHSKCVEKVIQPKLKKHRFKNVEVVADDSENLDIDKVENIKELTKKRKSQKIAKAKDDKRISWFSFKRKNKTETVANSNVDRTSEFTNFGIIDDAVLSSANVDIDLSQPSKVSKTKENVVSHKVETHQKNISKQEIKTTENSNIKKEEIIETVSEPNVKEEQVVANSEPVDTFKEQKNVSEVSDAKSNDSVNSFDNDNFDIDLDNNLPNKNIKQKAEKPVKVAKVHEEKVKPVKVAKVHEEKVKSVKVAKVHEEKIKPVKVAKVKEQKQQEFINVGLLNNAVLSSASVDVDLTKSSTKKVAKSEKVKPVKVAKVHEERVKPVKVAKVREEKVKPVKVAKVHEEKVKPVKVAKVHEERVKPVKVAKVREEKVKPVKVAKVKETKQQEFVNMSLLNSAVLSSTSTNINLNKPTVKSVKVAKVTEPKVKPVKVAKVVEPKVKPVKVAKVVEPKVKPVKVAKVAEPKVKPVKVAKVTEPKVKPVKVAKVHEEKVKPVKVAKVQEPKVKPEKYIKPVNRTVYVPDTQVNRIEVIETPARSSFELMQSRLPLTRRPFDEDEI